MKSCLHPILMAFVLMPILPLVSCGKPSPPSNGVEAAPSVSTEVEEPDQKVPVEARSIVEPARVPLTPWVSVPAGNYKPLYPGKDEPESVPIESFSIEEHAVTNAQFLRFVWEVPKWRRDSVKALFADENYLQHWPYELELDPEMANAPVTNVSWFAAQAYARWADRRLPTLAEWEYVAAASATQPIGRDEPGYNQTILNWYSQPTPLIPPEVLQTEPNFFGVSDMHGLVWEWIDDYNTALVTGESRGDAGLDRNLFCGAGSIGSTDPQDYAAFMRFAFRGSLSAHYTVRNLGFRCAKLKDLQ